MNDEELLRDLKNGGTAALEQLIDKYSRYVSAVLKNILRERAEDCEELTADVFFAVWENRDSLRAEGLKSYIGSVARNKAFNLIRRDKLALPLEEDLLILDGTDMELSTERKDTAQRLKLALDSLEPLHKELFVRHYYYGFTVAEAAKEMGINSSTAKTWLKRGRETLKEMLSKEDFF